MGLLVGYIFILFGVIFFFAGGGAAVIAALVSGRYADAARMPQLLFAIFGFAFWLFGGVLMLAGWLRGRRKP